MMSRSKSRSRSRTRSRSRSRSRSTSYSRSRSRSRSGKNRYRSRSRSRSRSYSPSYKREKKYPKAYQNSGDFRGYHRGPRRPFNFRGRGRGYFPRGRFQRGGRGGGGPGGGGGRGGYNGYNYNYNYNQNYWKNGKQRPPKQQQQQRYSKDGYFNSQKCSRSPTQSHSRHSDRSSTPLSRISHHSSPSSHSSSPKNGQILQTNQTPKDEKDQVESFKEVRTEGEAGDGMDLVQIDDAIDCSISEKTEGSQKGLTELNNSPKRADPVDTSAGGDAQNKLTTNQNDLNEGDSSQTEGSSSTRKKTKDGRNPILASFDFFSNDEYTDADKLALSVAFKKFLEEQNKKSQTLCSDVKSAPSCDGEHKNIETESLPRDNDGDSDGDVSLKCFLKMSPFLSNEEPMKEPIKKPNVKSSQNEDEPSKQKVAFSGFGKRQGDHEMSDESRPSQYQDKMFQKSELSGNVEEISHKRSLPKPMASSSIIPSVKGRNPERDTFINQRDESSFVSLKRHEPKFDVRMDYFGEKFIGSAEILAEEREFSHSLVQSKKRDQEFRSIFQHVQTPHTQRLPTELFAQHIVAIVHHVRAHHATPSGMSLSQRFAMYQRQAAEKETMKLRKSPEIHRIIDVSPSAFKKNCPLFEAMKSSEDCTLKAGEKLKENPMDLRLDIERRKKSSRREQDNAREQGKGVFDHGESSGERADEKYQKKSKKSKGKRSRSSSSSSSSSSQSQKDEDGEPEHKDDAVSRSQFGQRASPGGTEQEITRDKFQMRLRGRSWNKGNREQPKSIHVNQEEWDPEYTPMGWKYYLHDSKDGDENTRSTQNHRGQGRGTNPTGRARFIIRNAPTGPNIQRSNWPSNENMVKRKPESVHTENDQQNEKGGYVNGGTC